HRPSTKKAREVKVTYRSVDGMFDDSMIIVTASQDVRTKHGLTTLIAVSTEADADYRCQEAARIEVEKKLAHEVARFTRQN
ncbi:MAG: hypothetical protein WCX71_00005, partial [Candidatus Buchananbacteria bacterium]